MNNDISVPVRQFELKVTLVGITPPIWRRVRVPGDCTLDRLHRILQDLMGWHDMHLHDFRIAGRYYGRLLDGEDNGDLLDERNFRLDRLAKKGTRLWYRYDFGDDWAHEILVERVTGATPGLVAVECLDGARSVPPEDCGGVPGYDLLLRLLAAPDHPQYTEIRARYEDFDPDIFDRAAVNRRLRYHC